MKQLETTYGPLAYRDVDFSKREAEVVRRVQTLRVWGLANKNGCYYLIFLFICIKIELTTTTYSVQ